MRRGFLLPVEEQRGWHHHERGPVEPAGLFFCEQVGQGLRGLAQAHVVGQDAGQAMLPQVLHPGHALQLVTAKGQAQSCRWCHRLNAAGRTQPLRQLQHAGSPAHVPRRTAFQQLEIGLQAVQTMGIPRRELQRTVLALEVHQQIQQGQHHRL